MKKHNEDKGGFKRMKKFIPYILISWSLLALVGYHVLSAEAKEYDEER